MADWTFGNDTGASFDRGVNMVERIKQLKLERQKMAFEQIKQKYEMHTQAFQHAMSDFINNENMPASKKVEQYNNVVVPYYKTYLDVTLPPVSKWTDDVNDAADKLAGLYDDYRAGKLQLPELQSAVLHLKASVASNPKAAEAFKPADEVLNAAMGRATKELTVGNQKGTYQVDEFGNAKPLMVNGQAATGPTQESITQAENDRKAVENTQKSWLEAAKVVETAKETGIGADLRNMLADTRIGKWAGLTKNSTDQDVERAVNLAHGQLYMLGRQMGLTPDEVTNVVTGKEDANSIMNRLGKKFALPGATQLPGLKVTPKTAQSPTLSALPSDTTPAAPTQMAEAPTDAAAPATAPTSSAGNAPSGPLADSATEPTDQEEANV